MEKRVKVLKLTPHDNVGTALQDLKKGDTFQIILDGKVIGEDTAKTEIPFGFKAALGNIPDMSVFDNIRPGRNVS